MPRPRATLGRRLGCLAESREEVVAYLLATSTHFAAQAAVLVVGSVQFAFLGARQPGHRAGFDACAHNAEVRRRLPGQDAAGGVANVSAVEVEPYAPDQVGPIVLAEASRRRRRYSSRRSRGTPECSAG